MNTSSIPVPSGTTTPVRIRGVALKVRDLDRMLAYYRDGLGLEVIARDGPIAELGAGGVPFLTLLHQAAALPDDRRDAGLFHTAFLMPTRAGLARFIRRLVDRRMIVTGVADHHVSEAIYLDDPEGNGVEVYADRPAAGWRRDGRAIEITTEPLDVEGLLAAFPGRDPGDGAMPAGTRIGHVHLRVGDVAAAEQFYHGVLGMDVVWRVRGAAFLSSGGYHHHLAANIWHSAGAGRRDERRAGLAWLTLAAEPDAYREIMRRLEASGLASAGLRDPWGIRLKVEKT